MAQKLLEHCEFAISNTTSLKDFIINGLSDGNALNIVTDMVKTSPDIASAYAHIPETLSSSFSLLIQIEVVKTIGIFLIVAVLLYIAYQLHQINKKLK
jgi:hypothetical protein